MAEAAAARVDGAHPAAVAAGAAVFTWVLYVGLFHEFFGVFAIYADDAGVVLNSCLPWFTLDRWGEWFTKGFSEYAVNYPDWGPFGNNTLKPVVNLAFFLQGLLSGWLGDAAYLIAPYMATGVTAAVLVLAFRRLTGCSLLCSLILSLCVSTSALWIGSLFSAVDIVNTFAIMFSAIVLAVLPTEQSKPTAWLQLAIALLLLLAIFSHESAIALPIVCVLLLYALRREPPRVSWLWPYAAALVVWVILRFVVLESDQGIYALDLQRFPVSRVFAYWVASLFVPLDMRGTLMVRGLAPISSEALRLAIAALLGVIVLANLTFLLVVPVRVIAQRHSVKTLLLAVAFAVATAPRVLTAPSWDSSRFVGLPMIVGTILVFSVLEHRWRLLLQLATIVLLTQLGYTATGVVELKGEYIAESQAAAAFNAYVHESVTATKPDRVIVVNDRYGYFGVPAYVQLNAWPHVGFDTVVINHFRGENAVWTTGRVTDGEVDVRLADGEIVIHTRAEGGSTLAFIGATAVDFNIPNQGFVYSLREGTEAAPRDITARGPVSGLRTLVIGCDPAAGPHLDPVLIE